MNKDEIGTLLINSSVSSSKDYTVTIEKRVAPALENAGTVGLEKFSSSNVEGTAKWVSFTAAEDNTYTFTFTAAKDSNVNVNYYNTNPSSSFNSPLQRAYYNPNGSYYSYQFVANEAGDKDVLTTSEFSMNKGDTMYFALTTDSETAGVAASYSKKEAVATALEAGKDNPISIGADEKTEGWYKFTAAEEGMYRFNFSNANKPFEPTQYYKNLAKESVDNAPSTQLLGNLYIGGTTNREISLEAGQMIYLYFRAYGATKAEPATAVLNISKRTAADLNVGTANDLSTTPVDGWYKVTIPETGMYTYKFTDVKKDGAESSSSAYRISHYSNLNDYAAVESNFQDGAEKLYSAGQVLYLRISNSNAEKDKPVTSKLTISKRTVPAANKLTLADDGVTVEMKSEDAVWYSFTADENNYYTFKIKNVDGAAKNIQSPTKVYTSLISDYDENWVTDSSYTKYLKKGQSVYVKLVPAAGTKEDETAKANIRITKRTVATDSLAIGEKAVAVTKDQVAYYKFKATEDNKYTFTVSGVTAGNNMNMAYSQDLLSGTWDSLYSGSEVELQKGKLYYVRFTTTSAEAATAVVKITKREVTSTISKAAAKEISMTSADTVYYSYTALESGLYTFTATGVNKSLYYGSNIKLVNASTNRYLSASDDLQILFTRSMNAGQTIYIALQPNDTVSAEAAAKITIKVNQREGNVTPLKLGNDNDIKVTEKNTIQWYSFTSYEDNVYTFGLKSVTGTMNVSFADDSVNDAFSADTNLTSKMIVDEAKDKTNATIYIAVYATDVTSPVQAIMTISKRVVSGQLKAREANRVTLDKDGSALWYTFEASETGYYTAYALNSTGDVTARVFEAITNTYSADSASDTDFKMDELYLEKGDKYFYSFSAAGKPESDVIADIYLVPRTVSGQFSATAATSLTLTQNADKWYQFTAPEAGYYTITSADATAKINARVYSKLDDSTDNYSYVDTDGNNFSYEKRWFEAGESVYFKLNSSGATKTVSVTASVSVNRDTHNTLTKGSDNIVLTSTDERVYVFTASEDGDYRITISDANATLKVEDTLSGSTYYIYSNDTQAIDKKLNGNESIVLKISSSTASEKNSVSAKVAIQEKAYDYKESQAVTLSAGGDTVIEMTAPVDGTYVFESVSDTNQDTCAYLYADEECTEYLDYNDDAPDSDTLQFKLTRTMEAGETVYLKAKFLNSDVSGTFRVMLHSEHYEWDPSID